MLHVACDIQVVVSDLFESCALDAFLFFISFSYFQNVPSEFYELHGRAGKLGHGLRGDNVSRLPLFRPVLGISYKLYLMQSTRSLCFLMSLLSGIILSRSSLSILTSSSCSP